MSSTGVWLEENMISLPVKPQTSLSISSVREEQSTPQPSSFRICRMMGVGQRLDGKILPEALVPAEGLVDAAGVLTDALFVVDVERGGHVLDDLLGLLFGQKRSLFHNILPSRFYSVTGSFRCNSISLQVLSGGGKGGDHLFQLIHHALVVVLGGSGKILQLLVEHGQVDVPGRCHKDLVVLGAAHLALLLVHHQLLVELLRPGAGPRS